MSIKGELRTSRATGKVKHEPFAGKAVQDVGATYAKARKGGASNFTAKKIARSQAKLNMQALKGRERLGTAISRNVAETATALGTQISAMKIAETRSNENIAKAAIEKGVQDWNALISQQPTNPTTDQGGPSSTEPTTTQPSSGGSYIGG